MLMPMITSLSPFGKLFKLLRPPLMVLRLNGVKLLFRGTFLVGHSIFGTFYAVHRDEMLEILLVEGGHLRRDI